jgi:hypothetical protein
MTYDNAVGFMMMGFAFVGFGYWYLWCLWSMFFVCSSPKVFFRYYLSSGLFIGSTFLGVLFGGAWVIVLATN